MLGLSVYSGVYNNATGAGLVAAVLFLLLLVRVRWRRGLRVLPGPFWASFTNIDRLRTAASGQQFRAHIEYHRKFGSLVRVGPNHVSISDAHFIPMIYGIGSKFVKSDFYSVFDVNTVHGLVPTVFSVRDEAEHAALKRPVANAYALSSLLELEPMADGCTSIFQDKLREMSGQTFDLGVWLHWYAFDIISSVTFSNRLDFMLNETDVSGIIAAIQGRLVYNSVIGQAPYLHRFLLGNAFVAKVASKLPSVAKLASAKYIATFAAKQLDRYQSTTTTQREYRDILARFRRTRDGEKALTDSQLLSHAASNILAGSDTTAISLRALFYYLFKTPRCLNLVLEEIDAADERGDLSEFVTYAESSKLKYFQACLKEALRMHPAVGQLLERVIPHGGADFDDAVHLPAGTVVGINPWVLAYDRTVYGSDADTYRPERWLEAVDKDALKVMDRSFFAFGSGARTCLGRNISLMEMSKLVPQLLRKFTFELADPDAVWQLHDYWFVGQTGLNFRVIPRRGRD